jgi:hypothetical protein
VIFAGDFAAKIFRPVVLFGGWDVVADAGRPVTPGTIDAAMAILAMHSFGNGEIDLLIFCLTCSEVVIADGDSAPPFEVVASSNGLLYEDAAVVGAGVFVLLFADRDAFEDVGCVFFFFEDLACFDFNADADDCALGRFPILPGSSVIGTRVPLDRVPTISTILLLDGRGLDLCSIS